MSCASQAFGCFLNRIFVLFTFFRFAPSHTLTSPYWFASILLEHHLVGIDIYCALTLAAIGRFDLAYKPPQPRQVTSASSYHLYTCFTFKIIQASITTLTSDLINSDVPFSTHQSNGCHCVRFWPFAIPADLTSESSHASSHRPQIISYPCRGVLKTAGCPRRWRCIWFCSSLSCNRDDGQIKI